MAKRPLTAGEIALAKTVFGGSIDYASVRLHDRRVLPPGLQDKHQAVAKYNDISFPRSAYSDDFGAEKDAFKQSVFIHELVHVWQHQNRVVSTLREAVKETLKHKFNYGKCYLYKLDANKDLVRYGFEQQAAMIQDYFLLTHHNEAKSYKNRRIDAAQPGLKPKYEAVLKNFLADPRYAKNTMGRHKNRTPKGPR